MSWALILPAVAAIALGMGGELLAEPVSSPVIESTLAAAVLALAATMASSTVQLYHVLAFTAHVCRFDIRTLVVRDDYYTL